MTALRRAIAISLAVGLLPQVEAADRLATAADAIETAKKFVRARCTTETPCKYRAEREGSRWRVWVDLTKKHSPRDKAHPYPGGHIVLYFDAGGNLLRRVDGDLP